MDNLKQAYEQLGLSEDATIEEVEKRFSILARQARSHRNQTSEEKALFDIKNQAYRLILQHEKTKRMNEINNLQYGKYKKYAGVMEKTDHFFRYYKLHVFAAIGIIAIIIYGINVYMDNKAEKERIANLPPIDLSVVVLGDFLLNNNQNGIQSFEDLLLAEFPEWKRIEVVYLDVSFTSTDPTSVALQQKAVITLMTESPDIYILEDTTFPWVGRQGGLMNLDAIVESQLSELLPPDRAKKSKTQDDTEEHVYGIALDKDLFKEQLQTQADNIIAGVSIKAERIEKAIYFIEQYLRASQLQKR